MSANEDGTFTCAVCEATHPLREPMENIEAEFRLQFPDADISQAFMVCDKCEYLARLVQERLHSQRN